MKLKPLEFNAYIVKMGNMFLSHDGLWTTDECDAVEFRGANSKGMVNAEIAAKESGGKQFEIINVFSEVKHLPTELYRQYCQ